MTQCRAGNTFKAIYEATAQVINQGLVELGIYKSLVNPKILSTRPPAATATIPTVAATTSAWTCTIRASTIPCKPTW